MGKKIKRRTKTNPKALAKKRKGMKKKQITVRRRRTMFGVCLETSSGGTRIIRLLDDRPKDVRVDVNYGPRNGKKFRIVAVTTTGRRIVVWSGHKCPQTKPFIRPQVKTTEHKRTIYVASAA